MAPGSRGPGGGAKQDAFAAPDDRAVLRRFHPGARDSIRYHLAADASGRYRQLVRACPGAVVLIAGLEAMRSPPKDALWAVEKGGRLWRVLLLGALDLMQTRLHDPGVPADPEGDDPWAVSKGSDSIEGMAERIRLFVRRAGPLVSPPDLCGLPPPFFVPEDVPGDPRANADWYAAVRATCDEWLRMEDVPREAWSFVSRNAPRLRERAVRAAGGRCGRTVRAAGRTLARAVLRRGLCTGRWPGRRTDVRRFLEALRRWEDLERDGRMRARHPGAPQGHVRPPAGGEGLGGAAPDRDHEGAAPVPITLPPFDGPAVQIAGVELRPVCSLLELAVEGRRMEHCVATWAKKLIVGGRWIFSGSILGAPVTVDVRRLGGRYVIEQAKGFRNEALTAAQQRRLGIWLRAINGTLLPGTRRKHSGRTSPRPRQLLLPGVLPAIRQT